ncbi:hypothetical protein ACIBL8_11845 [Streptomyces sp. NPDC050523]|uniref:hypothetical protein n=1 Tax=Streptomyces sp. NPDC050523 TaxID=3365622 RepID=UPI0037B4126E
MGDAPDGSGIRGENGYEAESLLLETLLAEALADGPGETAEESLRLSTTDVRDQAARLPPDEARELLRREASRGVRWLRAAEFGIAGGDTGDGRAVEEALREHVTHLAATAALYGMVTGVPPGPLATEAAQVVALRPEDPLIGFAAEVLAHCYDRLERPELAFSVVVRSPAPAGAGEHLLRILALARRAVFLGRRDHVAALLAVPDWPGDPTGLCKELLHRLVDEEMPAEEELTARRPARQAALAAGDFTALRDLALFDVMWLETDPVLWRALSVSLRMTGAVERAELAHAAAEYLERRGGGR